MIEGDHKGDDEDSLNTNIARFDKFFHILPKLWPSIISKHELHGFVESKMACSQSIVPNLKILKLCKVIMNIQKIITIC
jgi:hypothetical protein